jgi:feruloyl-CoA synthase
MLCSNQQAIAETWPFLDYRAPVVVDWLPWSHTFGGNHNFNMILRAGGTLYIDNGKPAPGLFDKTIAALNEVSPTMYFNVPRGFELLAGALERDPDLAKTFFRELDVLFYAAAALPQATWKRLEAVAGPDVSFVAAWGSTETSPLVTQVHFPIERAGVIGLPAPGCALKLALAGTKTEMRVKGPNITPGYWSKGEVLPAPRDDEGYLPTGDAGRMEDPAHPERGVVFDGRLAENFKLTSGTWVAVGELRVMLLDACAPLVTDAVIAGENRDFIGVLLFPAPNATLEDIAKRLRAHNVKHTSNSQLIARARLLTEPPNIDAGEITDKGYINQRAVLDRRASDVEALFAEPCAGDVIELRRASSG